MQIEWQRVEDLFHGTLALAPVERAAYLSRECGENDSLRLEVESLISAFEVDSFIDEPAVTLGMRVLYDGLAGSLVGRSIGHYDIIRLLGEGGMGEVYLAEDRVLERQVALKFIASSLIGDEWARKQLVEEARAVAKLENFNICAVYGLEQVEGHHFIVMQFVEGETLSAVLKRGPLDVRQALEWADQLAGVLSVAHARGIVHRDVKPQNIMVTPDGQLKVLDFGLAKLTRQLQDRESDDGPNTSVGFVAGTAAYMSPEQTRGEELDGRSDIFSFGIVLCEMLGWANPIRCENDADTIAAIKAAHGSKSNGVGKVRSGLGRVVLRCLRKERSLRYESAGQLRGDLRELREIVAPRAPSFWKRLGVVHYATAAVALVLILAAAALVYQRVTRTYTLAILPITNATQDPNQDYLSQALTRNLYDKFSYLPRFDVRMPSVRPNKDEKPDFLGVGRDLRADAFLTGELVVRDGTLQLHVRLLETSNGSQTWEQYFAADSTSLLILQDEIAKEVTSKLGLWLIGDDRALLAKRQTNNPEALNYYMQGNRLLSLKRDRENIRKAIDYFERAIDLDPSFAKAYAGLADCFALTSNTLYGPISVTEARSKAVWAANKAIEADDNLAESHTSMGVVALMFDWNWQESEREFKRAIELKPDYAPARYWYSILLAAQQRFDEAIQQGELAKSYDPYSRLADMNYGRVLYYTRRYDDAAAHFSRLLDQDSKYPQFQHMMGWVRIMQGRFDEAISILETLYSKNPLHAAAALGYAYGKAGKTDKALGIINQLDELAKTEVVPPLEKAVVYIGLGYNDLAFSQLEACYAERNANLALLTTDPVYDSLRSDSRFTDLAARLNLRN